MGLKGKKGPEMLCERRQAPALCEMTACPQHQQEDGMVQDDALCCTSFLVQPHSLAS